MELLSVVAWSLLAGFLLLLAAWIISRRSGHVPKVDPLSCLDVLRLIKESHAFPVTAQNHWRLDSFQHGLRLWTRELGIAGTAHNYAVCGSFTKVKGSAQVVAGSILDTGCLKEHDEAVYCAQVVSSSPSNRDLSQKTKGSVIIPVRQDTISVECSDFPNVLVRKVNQLSRALRGEDIIHKAWTIQRLWHREETGCCWVLELNEDLQEWKFYLVQPVEGWFEIDQCLLTMITHQRPQKGVQITSTTALKLASLQNWLMYRKVQCQPVGPLTLPSSGEATLPLEPLPIKQPGDTETKESTQQNSSPTKAKSETTFLMKMRNLIEEKKEWYEERRKKQSQSPTLSSKSEEKAKAILTSSSSNGSQNIKADSLGAKGDSPSKSSFLKFLKSASRGQELGSATAVSSDKDGDQNGQVDGATGAAAGEEDTRETEDGEAGGSDEEDLSEPTETGAEGDKIAITCRTKANQVAADIMAENLAVSEIDISKPFDEQAAITGGWVFCGLDKDIVILRKIFDEGIAVQSYLGKGLLPVAPAAAFNAVKNPRTRFTYDDTLKKIDVVHDFGEGMKIVHTYHEVVQVFKKECRDFCLLQSERVEGDKYMVTLCSVDWEGCPANLEVPRSKFLSSGWIFEPAQRKGRDYTMVTYIVQIDMDSGHSSQGYLIEEMVVKQPLAIAFLRQYLAPSRPFLRNRSTIQSGGDQNENKEFRHLSVARSLSYGDSVVNAQSTLPKETSHEGTAVQ